MVKVQEATYTPGADGGEMRANVQAGNHAISVSWPLQGDQRLGNVLDRLTARVENMTFIQAPGGVEVRVSLSIAGRSFISRLPVDNNDGELTVMLDDLMQAIGKDFVDAIQAIPQEAAAESMSAD